MNLTVAVPDDLAARLHAAGASPERLALAALRRAADEMEHAQVSRIADSQAVLTGEALIAALQASPSRDIDLTPPRGPMPVRPIGL